MAQSPAQYPAQLSVDYPDRQLDRFSSFFRLIFMIPIWIVAAAIGVGAIDVGGPGFWMGAGFGSLFMPVMLLIVFRQKYPQWWYDFNLNITKFSTRVGVYFLLLTDEYPSTDEEQSVHIQLPYPNVGQDLNRWLPLVKWLLAVPPLHSADFPLYRADLCMDCCVVRHPVHWKVPTRPLRLHGGRYSMDIAGGGVCSAADHGRVPAVQSP